MDPITVDLGQNGGVSTFRTIGEARSWIDSERKYWQWLNFIANKNGMLGPVRDRYNDLFNRLDQAINDPSRATALADFKKLLSDAFLIDPLGYPDVFHSSSTIAEYLRSQGANSTARFDESLRERELLTRAALILAHELHIETVGDNLAMWRMHAAVEVELWKRNIPSADQINSAREAALSNLYSEINKASKVLTDKLLEMDEAVEARRKQTEREQKQHSVIVEKHKETITSIEDSFRKRMALEAPVKLWTDRAWQHRWRSWGWGIASFVLGTSALALLFEFVSQMFPDAAQIIRDLPAEVRDAGNASSIITAMLVSATAKFTAIALLVIWLIRIVVRNYLSHVHLAADAAERAAVIETFLAMSKDEVLREMNVIQEKGLPMALERAFARTQDGIVKDDAMPTPTVFSLGKSVTG